MTDDKYSTTDTVKQQTIQLYDSLSQVLDIRVKQLDVRDKIIKLNYTFFGYVASHTFINNSSVSYEDKFQSALMHFCECWWKWRWNGDDTHRGYRSDLSFSVFFKPRVGEMIERELNEVKYSIRRSLCMEVGAQLGKHWGKVTYDDLSNPKLHIAPDKLSSLKAIFGSLYNADLDVHSAYLKSTLTVGDILEDTDNYDTIEELLMNEMIETESRISESKLREMSAIYGLDIDVLKAKLPLAYNMLYAKLKKKQELQDLFYSGDDS